MMHNVPSPATAFKRGDSSIATLAQLSGDPVLAPYGAQLAKGVRADAIATRKAATRAPIHVGKGVMYDPVTRTSQVIPEYREIDEEEQRQKMEAISAKLDATPKKAIPAAVSKRIESAVSSRIVMDRLQRQIDTGVADPGSDNELPFWNTSQNWLAQQGLGTDQAKTDQRWWNEFNREWNIVRRNEKFGATLTKEEKRSWEGATINPEMTNEQIQSVLAIIQKYGGWEYDRAVSSARAGGRYSDDEIDALSALPPDQQMPTDDQLRQRRQAQAAPAQPGPQPGTVEGGYRFLGGDPANPQSWKVVQ